MEYRILGASGLEVPALVLGTGTFGGAGGVDHIDLAQLRSRRSRRRCAR
jgi:aryl-alcohol dehydrogenase-like predicted oxidoreductase